MINLTDLLVSQGGIYQAALVTRPSYVLQDLLGEDPSHLDHPSVVPKGVMESKELILDVELCKLSCMSSAVS